MVKTLIFILSIILVPLACFSFSLSDAYKDYLNGDYEEALVKAHDLKENDDVLYFLGLLYIKMGNYPQARDYLLRLSKNYPRSRLKEQGLVRFADAYFLENDLTKAKAFYEDIIKKYPSCSYMPLAYLRLVQIANREGQWDEKKKYLSRLKEKYPKSVEVQFINNLEAGEDFFTIQIGAFSNRNNAVSLKEEVSSQYETYIIEDKKQGYMLYKVRVGKFKSRNEAEKIYGKLIKQGYPARIYP